MGRLDGKVALVSGGASGIGRGAALALAREGAKVAVTDVQDGLGAEVVAEIEQAGGEAVFFMHDVTQEKAWIDTIAAVVDRFGGLNVLVNNAGIGIGGAVEDFAFDDWKRQVAVNLDGVFLGTKYAIPAMKQSGGGSIVNISSVAGLQGAIGLAGYCATKGGVRLFTKAVALELAGQRPKIRVNSIHPGVIDTPIWTKINTGGANVIAAGAQAAGANAIDPNVLASAMVPLRETGLPDDIGWGVVYLASDEARHVTGTELVIDGGITAGRGAPPE